MSFKPRATKATLSMHEGLGLPDALEKALQEVENRSAGKVQHVYDNTAASPASHQAKSLLSEAMYELYLLICDQGVDKVTLSYVFDRADGQVTTPAVRSVTHEYASVSAKQRCVWHCSLKDSGVLSMSGDEARMAVAHYASTANTTVAVGEGAEALHLALTRQGADLDCLLTVMWLIHLDVVASAEPRVRRRAATLRRLLAGQDVRMECEEAKALPGVRMHVNALDEVGRALLIAACDRGAIAGLSPRAARHNWPGADLTMYGGVLPADVDVPLVDPSATCRAIIAFSEYFGQLPQCANALSTALWLYGTPSVPQKLRLNVGMPRLHDSVHASHSRTGTVWRCRELVSPDIVGLANFMAQGMSQIASQTLRQVVHGLNEKDVTGVDAVLLGNHGTRVRKAGAIVQRALAPKYFSHVDFGALLASHTTASWDTTGFVHALMMGVVVSGSALQEVTQVMRVPTGREVAITDDPAQGARAKRAGAELYYASELLTDCGNHQNQSVAALSSDMPNGAMIHADVSLHQGSNVQLLVLGPSGSRQVSKMRMSAGWAPGPVAAARAPDVVTGLDGLRTLDVKLPQKPAQADFSADLVGARGPRAATRLQPGRPRAVITPPRADKTIVPEVDDAARQHFSKVLEEGWGPQPTSGEGAMCGANALRQSLRAQAPPGVAGHVELPELVAALRAVVAPDADPGDTEQILQGSNNFTADQLVGVLDQCGLRLGVVDVNPTSNASRAYVIGGDDRPVLWVHHANNHWSSVGPGGNKFWVPPDINKK